MYEGGPLWRPPPMNLFSGGMPQDLVEVDDYPYASGYVPPPNAQRNRAVDGMGDEMYSEALAASRRCGLTEAQRGRFLQMLTNLEPCRSAIGDVMVWCMEHADSASDISECVALSLSPDGANQFMDEENIKATEESTNEDRMNQFYSVPMTKLLSRLYLISDILYNSSAKVPNASFFRKCFDFKLPDVFRNLFTYYQSMEGKLKAEQLKQRVMVCFRAWEDWAIYPNDYLIKLQNIFLGLVIEMDDESDLAGVPLEGDTSKARAALDPDVEVLQSKPLVQYDGDPLDVDGSPLSDASEDEAPQAKRSNNPAMSDAKKGKSSFDAQGNRLFVPSKWETVDPITVQAEAVTTSSRWELLVDHENPGVNKSDRSISNDGRWKTVSGNSNMEDDDDLDGQPLAGLGSLVAYDDEDAASPILSDSDIPLPNAPPTNITEQSSVTMGGTSGISEERRAQLREIELKVVKYQDELEASRRGDKSITDEAITKQIKRYRERLMDRLEESDSLPMKKSASSTSSKSKSKSSKPYKSTHREHRTDSPSLSRDFRDRSPPRSFRERDRGVRRRSPSPVSPTDLIEAYPLGRSHDPSPACSQNRSRIDDFADDRHSSSRGSLSSGKQRFPSEELEEGEASEEEEAAPTRLLSRRRSLREADSMSASPKTLRKRQRSRSPSPPPTRYRRSRSPSPGRKRSNNMNNSSSKRR